MIYLVIIGDRYFRGVSDCGGYAETTAYLSEAWASDNDYEAIEVAKVWNGKLRDIRIQ